MSMILIFKVSSPELKALNHKIISQCKYFKILPTKTSLWIKPLNLNKRIYTITNSQFPGTTQFWSQESQDHAVPNEKRFKAIWFLQDLLTLESIHIYAWYRPEDISMKTARFPFRETRDFPKSIKARNFDFL